MKKKSNLFTKLLLLFTIVPIIEVYILIQLAEKTNWLTTILIVVLTGAVGAHLAKTEGLSIISKIKNDISRGNIPDRKVVEGLCILIGGVFLITPGILTDITGFTLIIPYTRNFYSNIIYDKIKNKINLNSDYIHVNYKDVKK